MIGPWPRPKQALPTEPVAEHLRVLRLGRANATKIEIIAAEAVRRLKWAWLGNQVSLL